MAEPDDLPDLPPSAEELALADRRAAFEEYAATFTDSLPWRLLDNVDPADLAAGLREFVASGVEPDMAALGKRFGFTPPTKDEIW